MTILAQLFWLAVSLLESDYEHEFLLACRLLSRVLHRLPLDRPDARDKVEKLQQQLKWLGYPGVHALLLKVYLLSKLRSCIEFWIFQGCTHSATYEPTITLLSQLAPLLRLEFVFPKPHSSDTNCIFFLVCPFAIRHKAVRSQWT